MSNLEATGMSHNLHLQEIYAQNAKFILEQLDSYGGVTAVPLPIMNSATDLLEKMEDPDIFPARVKSYLYDLTATAARTLMSYPQIDDMHVRTLLGIHIRNKLHLEKHIASLQEDAPMLEVLRKQLSSEQSAIEQLLQK